MKIVEFVTPKDVTDGYYDPAADTIDSRRPDDTRKPVLMLNQINRLKKMRAQSKLEALKRQDLLAVMYGGEGNDDTGGGGGGGFGF